MCDLLLRDGDEIPCEGEIILLSGLSMAKNNLVS